MMNKVVEILILSHHIDFYNYFYVLKILILQHFMSEIQIKYFNQTDYVLFLGSSSLAGTLGGVAAVESCCRGAGSGLRLVCIDKSTSHWTFATFSRACTDALDLCNNAQPS